MEYFKILSLSREPFSNSPDPALFYQSRQHLTCLQRLEMSLRMQRGLNVVIGEVGTGKTTLCRQLIRHFADDRAFEFHLLLDPYFTSPREALAAVAEQLDPKLLSGSEETRDIKERIKQHLFQKGVPEGKTVVLLIDEGQKLPVFLVEILREFLNYETNDSKLLQIVIFAQKEFEQTLQAHANFTDRINLYYVLKSFNFCDTKEMIRFRLRQSGGENGIFSYFTYPALWEIYRTSNGYPRKIVHLCHQSLLMMIIQNRSRVGRRLVRRCGRRYVYRSPHIRWKWTFPVLTLLLFTVLGGGILARNELASDTIPPAAAVSALLDSPPAMDEKKTAETQSPPEPVLPGPPEVLGQVTIQPSETLGGLIKNIYGSYTRELLQSVMAVNPEVSSPERISVGQTITFPAVSLAPDGLVRGEYPVRFQTASSMGAAYQSLREYAARWDIPLRLMPFWTPEEGLTVALVLDECFSDEESARKRIRELQPDMPDMPQVLKDWEKATIVFGKPFCLQE